LALGTTVSPLVDRMVASFGRQGFRVAIDTVPYEFRRGGNEMMRIRR